MANVKTKKKKNSAPLQVHEISGFDKLIRVFPKIQITKWSESNRGKCGREYITDIVLPKCYTLISRQISHKGEVLAITFSVQEKHCSENQIAGIYHVTA